MADAVTACVRRHEGQVERRGTRVSAARFRSRLQAGYGGFLLAACCVLLALFLPQALVRAQGSADELLKELERAWNGGASEETFRAWVRSHASQVTHEVIVGCAFKATRTKNESLLQCARVLAQERNADSTSTAVTFQRAEYYFYKHEEDSARTLYASVLGSYERRGIFGRQATIAQRSASMAVSRRAFAEAVAAFTKAAALYEKAGDQAGIGDVHIGLGDLAVEQQDAELASVEFAKAKDAYTRGGSQAGLGWAEERLGKCALDKGRNAEALEHLQGAKAHFEAVGDEYGMCIAYKGLGHLLYYTGSSDSSRAMYRKALAFATKVQAVSVQAASWVGIGYVEVLLGNDDTAHVCFEKAIAIFQTYTKHVDVGEVNARIELGELARKNGRVAEAKNEWERALTGARSIGYLVGEANVSSKLGRLAFNTGMVADARTHWQEALALFERAQMPLGTGDALRDLGELAYRTGAHDSAKAYWLRALHIFEAGGYVAGIAQVYYMLGDHARGSGENGDATDYWQKALTYFERAGMPAGMARVYAALAEADFFSAAYEHGEVLHAKALELYQSAHDRQGLSDLYDSKAKTALNNGAFDTARSYAGKALELATSARFESGQGNALLTLGHALFRLGEYEAARESWKRAMERYQACGDRNGVGLVEWTLGEYALSMGAYSEAGVYLGTALEKYTNAGDVRNLGLVYQSLGRLAQESEDWDKARQYSQEALTNFRSTGNALGVGNMLRSLGTCALYQGSTAEARHRLQEAIAFMRKINDVLGPGNVYYDLAECEFRERHYAEAAAFADSALASYRKSSYHNSLVLALFQRAKMCDAAGWSREAAASYRDGIAEAERARSRIDLKESREGYLRQMSDGFEMAAQFFLRRADVPAAFAVIEKGRARVFLDRMTERSQKAERALPPVLRARRDALDEQRAMLGVQIELSEKRRLTSSVDSLQRVYAALGIAYDSVMAEVRASGKTFAALENPQPVELRELCRAVLKPREWLIEYVVTDSAAYAIVAQRDTTTVVRLDATRASLSRLVAAYLDCWSRPPQSRRDSSSGKLYTTIFKPLEGLFHRGDVVLVVPDDMLSLVPFECMVAGRKARGENEYLLERYTISYVQSASVLAELRAIPGRSRTPRLLAFGDPVYDYSGYSGGKPEQCLRMQMSDRGGSLDSTADTLASMPIDAAAQPLAADRAQLCRLRYSEPEVLAIAREFHGRSRVLLREEALEDSVKAANWTSCTHVVFSCHGTAGKRFNGLILSQQVPGAKENGFLMWQEAINCEFDADVMVLSACETGKGEVRRGEGVAGLVRAMMIAGSRAVVASLWSVNDPATAQLTARFFHKLIKEKKSKRTALREAKLELLRTQDYADPYYWAGFAIYGD